MQPSGHAMLWTAVVALGSVVPLELLCSFDVAWLAFTLVAILAGLVLIARVVAARSSAALVILALYLPAAFVLSRETNDYPFRATLRWTAYGNDARAATLGSPARGGELRHTAWDGWGWFGTDTETYLVFDPRDSLARKAGSARPGTVRGLPCAPDRVERLEPHWYAVRFFTDESWDRCAARA